MRNTMIIGVICYWITFFRPNDHYRDFEAGRRLFYSLQLARTAYPVLTVTPTLTKKA